MEEYDIKKVTQFMFDAKVAQSKAKNLSTWRADVKLYEVLSDCLQLCSRIQTEGILDKLKDHIIAETKNSGNKKTHFKAKADKYLIVGRLIFGQNKSRASTWRYTACLREAAKKQINADQIVPWLIKNGGLNSLFETRSKSK